MIDPATVVIRIPHMKECKAVELSERGELDTPWIVTNRSTKRDKRGYERGRKGGTTEFLIAVCSGWSSKNQCEAKALIAFEYLSMLIRQEEVIKAFADKKAKERRAKKDEKLYS